MSILLINADQAEEVRVALLEKKNTCKISNLYIENPNKRTSLKNIYAGIVSNVRPGLNALFIKYEVEADKSEKRTERHGFLPFSEIAPAYFKEGDRKNMENFLDRKIIIQIKKEERGNKGALLTTYITLAGSYLVLMPNNPRSGGISKRIDHNDRKSMKEIINQLEFPKSMSIILRTAGVDKPLKELQNDLNLLITNWNAIEEAFQSQKAPFLIFQEGDILARAIRDYLREDIEKIIVDDPKTFEKVQNYTSQIRPDLLKKLYLHRSKKPLFLAFDIEDEVESAFQSILRLPSGGTIVINRCEALTAIDINSGGSTRHKDIAETALKTNLEAAEVIARQLRLRDIGGLIVIDFIDMENEEHKRQVEKRLLDSTVDDRARIQMNPISSFGLLEMSRQRLRASLGKTNEDVCPYCQGDGTKRSTESLALAVIRTIEKKLFERETKYIQVKASIELMTYLSNEKRSIIRQLEEDHNCTLILTSTFDYKNSYYEILDFGAEEFNPKLPSYTLQSNDTAVFTSALPFEIPAVKGFGQERMTSVLSKQGLLGQVMQNFNKVLQSIKRIFISQKASSPSSKTHNNRFKKVIPSNYRRSESVKSTPKVIHKPATGTIVSTQPTEIINTDASVTLKKIVTAAEELKPMKVNQQANLQKDSQETAEINDKKQKVLNTQLNTLKDTNISSANHQSLNKTPTKKTIVHRYGGEAQVKKRNYFSQQKQEV